MRKQDAKKIFANSLYKKIIIIIFSKIFHPVPGTSKNSSDVVL